MLNYEDTDTSSLSDEAGFLRRVPPSHAINKNARKLSTATKLSTINSPTPFPLPAPESVARRAHLLILIHT